MGTKNFTPSFLKPKKKTTTSNGREKGKGKVIINKKLYRAIVASSVRFANSRIPESEWAEVYGILIGRVEGDNVIVSEAYPMTHTMKRGHILKVSYDSEDYVHSVAIEEEAYTHDPPEFIVGWYHSHPGIRVMFSQDDIKNQLFWQQANPLAIGLVFNHVRLMRQIEVSLKKGDAEVPLNNDPGFKIFRLKDPSKGIQADYVWIPYEFSDATVDEVFIEEAKKFVKDVTRLFRRVNFYEQSKQMVEILIGKLEEIYAGTKAYINTLIKQGNTARISNVIETQSKEIKKNIENADKDIDILREIINYVEYKERELIIPKMKELFTYWENKKSEYLAKFDELKDQYNI
ncbi:MAG: Mov34/MPN/PAD-1 family protein [Promethearchaeota archaeon]